MGENKVESLLNERKMHTLIIEFAELAERLNANLLELQGACNALRVATEQQIVAKYARQRGVNVEFVDGMPVVSAEGEQDEKAETERPAFEVVG